MIKCAICGRQIVDKKHMVTVKTGKWFRRKKNHFHLSCFVIDKARAKDVATLTTKS